MCVCARVCVCVSVFTPLFIITLGQKIDVITADVSRGGKVGKKELWQLSDESEASVASADDDVVEDEDDDDDASVDSDGVVGAQVRKPRPAKLIAVSSNDAERRQQRQVKCQTWRGACDVKP